MGRNDKKSKREFGSTDFSRFSSFNKGGFSSAPREMHSATCAECGNKCDVPFKPSGDRPVYCRDCYAKHRPARDFS